MSHASSEETPRKSGRSVMIFLRDVVIILLLAVLLSFLMRTFLVRSFYIPSGSMQHTLEIEDRIIVNQLVPGLIDVQRGDIVVFEDPGGWLNVASSPEPTPMGRVLQVIGLAADTSTDYVVKRVIGVGGDRVQCCDDAGRVMINGVPIDEPYIVVPSGETAASRLTFDVVVPENSVWVMGDNRYSSKDSRYNQDQPGRGFVSEEAIVGRAFAINWPLGRLSWLGNYPETFEQVPDAAIAAN